MGRVRRKMIVLRRVLIVGGLVFLAVLLAGFAVSLSNGNSAGFSTGPRIRAAGSEWGNFLMLLIIAPFAVWAEIKNWR